MSEASEITPENPPASNPPRQVPPAPITIEPYGEFDFSQSGMRQLYDRIDELAEAATKANLLDLVSNILGELDCLAICTSGVIEASEEEPDRPAAT